MPAEVYDGDTTPYRREKIRNHLPNVIFTTPDMLHLAINQFHSKTSALELGVDIGGLDACILVGYPGSVSSTWQRAGRVGRHGQESVIIMVGMQDALDQYIETDVPYYTQALGRDETAIIGEKEIKKLASLTIAWGLLSISSRITGYEKKNIFDRTRLSRHELVMPEYLFETEGLWIALDDRILNAIDAHGFDLAGSMHAVEHASIACMPLFALCDKGDIGGLSYTLYPGLKKPVIFVYDGHEGGIGLTRRAFDVADEWFRTALAIITECGCDSGCPECVQDPQCGSGNQPLDKEGAEFILRRWTDS